MMRKKRRGIGPGALAIAFVIGMLVDAWLRIYGPPMPRAASNSNSDPRAPAPRVLPSGEVETSTPPPVPRSVSPTIGPSNSTESAAIATTGRSKLRLPLEGIDVESLKGGFAEARTGHPHEAVDLLAPRNTPVHAVQDGTVAKLFVSNAGGNTIYEFDKTGQLAYYYAHLERYATGLREGDSIRQGQIIGYVGTSGNAPPDTPHLHFAVFELGPERQWWKGKAIDPYPLFR